jgi:hypothetical protein
VASLTDSSRGIIYSRGVPYDDHMIIVMCLKYRPRRRRNEALFSRYLESMTPTIARRSTAQTTWPSSDRVCSGFFRPGVNVIKLSLFVPNGATK